MGAVVRQADVASPELHFELLDLLVDDIYDLS